MRLVESIGLVTPLWVKVTDTSSQLDTFRANSSTMLGGAAAGTSISLPGADVIIISGLPGGTLAVGVDVGGT